MFEMLDIFWAHLPVPLIPDGRIRASYFPAPKIWSNNFFSFSRKFIFALFALQRKTTTPKNRNNVWLLWIGSKRDRYIVIKNKRQKIESSKRKILTAMHCISMPEEKATGNVTFSFLVWTSLFIDSAWQFVIVLSFGRIVLSRLSSSFQKRISVFLSWLSKFNPMNPRGKSTELSSDIDPICWNSAKESNLPLLNFIGKKKSLIERTRANWIHSVHKS